MEDSSLRRRKTVHGEGMRNRFMRWITDENRAWMQGPRPLDISYAESYTKWDKFYVNPPELAKRYESEWKKKYVCRVGSEGRMGVLYVDFMPRRSLWGLLFKISVIAGAGAVFWYSIQ